MRLDDQWTIENNWSEREAALMKGQRKRWIGLYSHFEDEGKAECMNYVACKLESVSVDNMDEGHDKMAGEPSPGAGEKPGKQLDTGNEEVAGEPSACAKAVDLADLTGQAPPPGNGSGLGEAEIQGSKERLGS
eukprot:10444769-Lingulodinium_polyedra.AAC.1